MSRLARLAAVVLAVVACSCGKRGNPLPPLRPVPARVADATALRTSEGVTLKFTVPAANLDGTTPLVISRVDVYAWSGPQGATPPAASVIASERSNLRSSVPVTIPVPDDSQTAPPPKGLTPGSAAVVVDALANIDPVKVAALAYVVVPVAGSGRGRSGPPSPPLLVPLAALPAPPPVVTLTSTETEVRATWEMPSAVAGQTFQVVRTSADGAPLASAPTVPPVSVAEATFPVEFGREVCIAVRPVLTAGRVTTEGTLSRPACLTPSDRYAPAAPAGFQAVQDGAAVTLSWSGVAAQDLAGYVVLRGTGSADDLQPLMRTAIRETNYRDTTVRPGVTYFYAVYAADTATPPNISQLSNRQTVTVR